MNRAKLTFICREDFANVSTEIARALRACSTRWDARVIALAPHLFNYDLKHDWDLATATYEDKVALNRHLVESEVVVWAEEPNFITGPSSAYSPEGGLVNVLKMNRARRCFTFHAGNSYRAYAAKYNPLDHDSFDGQLCSPDLLRLANPGARAVWAKPMRVDLDLVDRLWKARREHGKIVVTHSPSDHVGKGTPMIRRVMANVVAECPNVEYRELGGPFGQHLSHVELLAQREAAVLHFDQYHTACGGIGIASYEALALGTLPLGSMNRTSRAAYQHWGFTQETHPAIPMVFDRMERANERQTERGLTKLMVNLARTSLDELEARGRAGARWVHDHFSDAPFVAHWEAQIDALEKARGARAA